jgi:hypothetical protein
MANKTAQIRWIVTLGIVVLIGVLAYSSFQQTNHEYEVCMAFKGTTHCSTAAGATYEQAVRSAEGIDCELLSNGRDENMVCLDTQPASVREVKK